LREGDILVSNFNNSDNLQGTGTTIVRIRNNQQTLFFQDANLPGLSTALGVLKRGFVLVGNVPSANGSGVCNNLQQDVGQGALTVIDREGNVLQTLTDPIFLDGPWDLTIRDEGDRAQIFVSNVRNGTVSRLDVRVRGDRDDYDYDYDDDDDTQAPLVVVGKAQVAVDYPHRCDAAAFVVGPTGLAFDERSGVLFVASTVDNTIFAVPDAAKRTTPVHKGTNVVPARVANAHLHGPLGLLLAPNRDLVSAQGDAINPDPNQPSEIVELTQRGQFVAQKSIDPALGGAFGIALQEHHRGFTFAAVDDNTASLQIYVVP
jgi:hypothetical protein